MTNRLLRMVLILIAVIGAIVLWHTAGQPGAEHAPITMDLKQTHVIGTPEAHPPALPAGSASATVDENSLTAAPGEIFLTGSSNVANLFISIDSDMELMDSSGNSAGKLAFSSGIGNPIRVVNGRWSVDAGNLRQTGTYTVRLDNFSNFTTLNRALLTIRKTQ